MRPEGWEMRLAAEIAAGRTRPWAWGSHDCATFARLCAAAMTGADLFADLTGYRTRAGALRVLRAAGFDDLRSAVDARLASCPPLRARRGDVALIDGRLGVVEGAEVLVAAEPAGLARLRLRDAESAWRVG